MSKNIVVFYGSGASFNSGYKVRVLGNEAGKFFPDPIKPPTDQGFFSAIKKDFLKEEYPALWKFLTSFFPPDAEVGMEDVWTALDLNHKHITLGTYDWSKDNEAYLDIQSKYPSMDLSSSIWRAGGALDTSPNYNQYKFLGDCGRDFRRLLYNVYSNYELDGGLNCFLALHNWIQDAKLRLLGYITFNYDCLLEDSLKDQGWKYISANFDTSSVTALLYGDVPIIKLHGSLSWKECLKDRGYTVVQKSQPFSKEIQVTPEYSSDSDWTQPAIIPPTLFKQEINDDQRANNILTQTILSQWKAAIAILQEADLILSVGYSFPPSDFHSKRVFQLAGMVRRRNNKKVARVLSCGGPNAEEKGKQKETLKAIFGTNADMEITSCFDHLVKGDELKFLTT